MAFSFALFFSLKFFCDRDLQDEQSANENTSPGVSFSQLA